MERVEIPVEVHRVERGAATHRIELQAREILTTRKEMERRINRPRRKRHPLPRPPHRIAIQQPRLRSQHATPQRVASRDTNINPCVRSDSTTRLAGKVDVAVQRVMPCPLEADVG